MVACSMGGWIALCTAAYRPEAVNRLVLISAAAGVPTKMTWGSILISIIFNPSEKNLRKFGASLFGSGAAFRDWIDYFLAAAKDRQSSKIGMPTDLAESDLRKVSAPVLLLVGENDPLFADVPGYFENARRLLPYVETAIIPGAGHLGHDDNPEFVNAAIMRGRRLEKRAFRCYAEIQEAVAPGKEESTDCFPTEKTSPAVAGRKLRDTDFPISYRPPEVNR